MADIDPIQYGALTAQVGKLEEEVRELRADMRQLIDLANKGRGGLWVGMAFVSMAGGVVGFFADHFLRR